MHRLSLLLKAIVIFVMTLAILIPLAMIRSTIADRQSFRQQAVASIAESYAGAQTVVGPLVIVPYSVDVPVVLNDVNGVAHTQVHSEQRHWMFFPKDLHLDGQVKTNVRYRGLHEVRVYELDSKLTGHFDFTPSTQVTGGTLRGIGTPFLSIGVDDVRGLIGSPLLRLDGRPATLLHGPGDDRAGAGVHAELPAMVAGQPRTLDVTFDFVLGGTERLAIAPIADNNRIELTSAWRHPEFAGRFLPHTRNISAEGFDAVWEISALAANTQSQYEAHGCASAAGAGCAGAASDGGDAQGCGPATTAVAPGTGCPGAGGSGGAREGADRIELTLVDPVNIYTQADRASKYGLLFVLLTFVGFFMFELIKQLRIHPIQYLLVGLALAIFFLLLISLSEHIPFIWAYLVASGACIGLLGFYLSHVLRSRARGIGFATMLTALYAVLYGLLISEDNALVLGSIMLFAILAAIMVITRKIDWYRVGQQSDAIAATQP